MQTLSPAVTADSPRLAAIDAGSNGIRIVIGSLADDGTVKRRMSHRVALRLGHDSFLHGRFQPETLDTVVETFTMFRRRLDKHRVEHLRSVATSATRTAENGEELIDRIRDATGIELEIIDGQEEARLVFLAVAEAIDLTEQTALLIDMGGGSVELTLSLDGVAAGSDTLPLGPVRLMFQLATRELEEADLPLLLERYGGVVEDLVEKRFKHSPPDLCIGTGGNIECLARLRKSMLSKTRDDRVKLGDLESLIPQLLAMPIEERRDDLKLRQDRADLIAIAAQVLHHIADEARIDRIQVPDVGLKDGLLCDLARQVGVRLGVGADDGKS